MMVKRQRILWTLLLAAGVAACDAELPTVDESRSSYGHSSRASSESGTTLLRLVQATSSWPLTASQADAVIGSEGGSLAIFGGMIRLAVPANAVTEPTRFHMRFAYDGYLTAELTATSVATGKDNDVGAAGFRRPVNLEFDYRAAEFQGRDLNNLAIVWRRPDGTLEPVATHVFRSQKFIRGSLSHFSGYSVADRCQDEC